MFIKQKGNTPAAARDSKKLLKPLSVGKAECQNYTHGSSHHHSYDRHIEPALVDSWVDQSDAVRRLNSSYRAELLRHTRQLDVHGPFETEVDPKSKIHDIHNLSGLFNFNFGKI